MLRGAAIGAASGFIGGGVASAIGGGGGAFAGGAAADITGQLISNGDVNLGQSLIAGGLSLGLYHGSTFLSYQSYQSNHMPNQGPRLSYRQFNAVGVAYQKSRFWKKEFGGYLMDDGSVKTFSASERRSFAIIPNEGIPDDAWGLFHSHWERPGELIFHNSNYNKPSEMDLLTGNVTSTRASRWHSPADLGGHGGLHSFVINRYDASYLKPNWLAAVPFTGGFPRFSFSLPYFGF